ncbi:MAG: phosphatidate cytidylyltransferase [Candidatus Omnitrophota bacterium]|nr:MAG: phosphatidate cytidylyltransferase [Candidatus Omnitrophota bacterium]
MAVYKKKTSIKKMFVLNGREVLGKSISKRVITSSFLGLLAIFAILHKEVCWLAVSLFTFIALYEFFYMVEKKGVRLFKPFGLTIGVLIPITVYFRFPVKEWVQFSFVILGLFILFLLELTKKETHQPILSISATVFGIIYISWCCSFLIRIRQLPEGAILLGFLLLVTKSSDIGAYLWGKKFGKTLFLERVSPKKSLEGAIGGLFTSVGAGLVFSVFVTSIRFLEKFLLILILAGISQLGDLFESLLKRDCQVKDSGKLLPGMGGVLDVIDSVIFTAPTFYLYLTMMR